MPRAVVDACALVPAIVYQDNLYQAIAQGKVQPVFCPELRDEVSRGLDHILTRRVSDERLRYAYRALWALIEARSDHIGPMPPDYVVEELGDHQKDAHLFWTCERSGAEVLITTEKRLWKELGEWRGIPILKPSDALEQFGLARP